MIKLLKNEFGYSLVEVMASIVILSVAIIPMVAMFDMGLKSATTSGNYDTARSLANKHLERAKNYPYADVRDDFPFSPAATPTAAMTGGAYTTPANWAGQASTAAPHSVPSGFGYTVSKRYLQQPSATAATSPLNNAGGSTDTGMIEVTVSVTRPNSSVPYSATAVVAGS